MKRQDYITWDQYFMGIAMLSAVLKSDVAVQVSIKIMDAFIEMRHFIAGNALMF